MTSAMPIPIKAKAKTTPLHRANGRKVEVFLFPRCLVSLKAL